MKYQINNYLSVGLLSLAVICQGCKVQTPNQPQPTTVTNTYYPLELGNSSNFFSFHKTFFLGQRVDRFRLKVHISNPGRTGSWIKGIFFRISSNTDTIECRIPNFMVLCNDLAPDTAADGSFWTRELTGNTATLQIFSNNRVDFLGGHPIFEILGVERHFRSDVRRDDFPASSSVDRICPLPIGLDVIGMSTEVAGAQYYKIPLRGLPPTTFSIYVSPRFLSTANRIGLRVHISDTGFVRSDANVAWHEPETDDSGIYSEFTSNGDKFLTVTSTIIAPYLIRATSIAEHFDNIVVDRDERMETAPSFDVDGLRGDTSLQKPFTVQFADYVHANANYDRRIRETFTFACAFSLAATDGQMRFRSADLYRNFTDRPNEDISFEICPTTSCRANASPFSINMFDVDINDPIGGGWTLNHEWGHWQYNLPDEYTDVTARPPVSSSLAIDPNSLMGTQEATEFCYPRNHLWAPDVGGEEESCWIQLEDQYRGRIRTVAFATQSHAQYFDVLHKLESLINIRVH